MMTSNTQPSAAALLVLYVTRVTGFADEDALSARSGVDYDTVVEWLGDFEAHGWVAHHEFAGVGGWAITERGRAEDCRRLTEELARTGARGLVEAAHEAFEPLNARVVRACTEWQLRPQGGDRLAANDHDDATWDHRVLDELSSAAAELARVVGVLVTVLPRFGGYHQRFSVALSRARAGQTQWVAGTSVASAHAVWMELHEDLVSTLGISRRTDPTVD